MSSRRNNLQRRRAAIVVWTAILLVVLIGMVAFAVDVGYMLLVRTQLQAAADAAAMASAAVMAESSAVAYAKAREYANYHIAGGTMVDVDPPDVELGIWDATSRTFTPTNEPGNAVRVTTRRNDAGLFFGRVLGRNTFSTQSSAVAMANPRDISFVVDLSGSMNDDTEPAWSTGVINSTFGPQGYPNVGNQLMKALFADFDYGSFPGTLQYIGQGLAGVEQNKYAYAQMTMNGGPLTAGSIPSKYRIVSGTASSYGDNEMVRKQKAYSWIIDNQLAKIMPNAKPIPSSAMNYAYWEKYLDYLLISQSINLPKPPSGSGGEGGGGGGGGDGGGGSGGSSSPKPTIGFWQPDERPLVAFFAPPAQPAASSQQEEAAVALSPGNVWAAVTLAELATGVTAAQGLGNPQADRGKLPPSQDSDRIDGFNNPNKSTFPSASSSLPQSQRNYVGYLTYVQFMMDHGHDLEVIPGKYSPLSVKSSDCPFHAEGTAGGSFSFPPREQPTHAARRALIAAINVVKDRNHSIPDPSQRDWVSVITFDTLNNGGPKVLQPLTGDYDQAMASCTRLQAVGDKGASTATEAGLITAENHLKSKKEGGAARQQTNKVLVLLTDGVPNLYSSSDSTIDAYMNQNPDADYYGGGYYWLDAALMQAAKIQSNKWQLFPVGVGLGTDYSFMNRMGRMGGTADDGGQSPRGSGNPAEYEQRLTDIFQEIITNPRARLVK